MAKKKKRKKSKNTIFIYLSIITVVVLLWVNHNSKKVQVLYLEEFTNTYKTNALVIKNEAETNLMNEIDFNVKEGERVSKLEVLSESKNISFSEYYNREIDIINWLLDNEAYREKNLFDQDLTDIEEQLVEIDKDIEWAQNLHNDDKEALLNKDKEELLEKKSYIIKSFQYAGVDKETLLSLKEEYSGMKDSTGSSITLNKLNFDFPGYIYFNSDGYENLLNVNILEYLTPEYISNIDDYNKKDENTDYGQTVKVVDDTYMYLAVVVPKDVVITQEKSVLDRKESIMNDLETNVLKDYYSYLNRRVDVLKSLPTLKYEYDHTRNSGFIVDIREYGDEKVIILELKDDMIRKLLTKRKISVDLITYANDGYVIPEKSIVKIDGKDNIVVTSKGYLKKYLEVNISHKDSKNVFLELSENENITEGMQLILNP